MLQQRRERMSKVGFIHDHGYNNFSQPHIENPKIFIYYYLFGIRFIIIFLIITKIIPKIITKIIIQNDSKIIWKYFSVGKYFGEKAINNKKHKQKTEKEKTMLF